jgi:hypothetical protein
MSSSYFQDLIRLRQVSQEPLVYESIHAPVKMGNATPIAYGGWTSALAFQAAFHSLPGVTDADRAPWAAYTIAGVYEVL